MAVEVTPDAEFKLDAELSCFNPGCLAQGKVLNQCSRCHIAGYCSKECQKVHYEEHKAFCMKLKKLRQAMAKDERRLQRHDMFDNANVGHFWGLHETRPYCRARHAVGEVLLHRGEQLNRAPLCELALTHYMELLRLIHGDNMGIRSEVPAIMVALGRDQDAFDFISWWLTIDPDGRYDWGSPPPSLPGDWLYGRGADMHGEVFALAGASTLKYVDLDHLAVLALIKMRILNRIEAQRCRCAALRDALTAAGTFQEGEVDAMLSIVCHLLMGPRLAVDAVVSAQQCHLDCYLAQMVDNNEVLVKALINPEPLRAMPPPGAFSRGSVEEAWLVLSHCGRAYERTPSARDRLRALVGDDPQYDPTYSPSMF